MHRVAPLALVTALIASACSISSADRPSCLALADAYVSIVRESVPDEVPADVTARTLERADAALSAAVEDGDADQERRCRVLVTIAVAARDLPPDEFALFWTELEDAGLGLNE